MIQIGDCQTIAEMTCDFVNGALPASENKLMADHILTCNDCRAAVKRYVEVRDLMQISERARSDSPRAPRPQRAEVLAAASVSVDDSQSEIANPRWKGLAALGSAPWWLVSCALHILVIALASLISMSIELPQSDDAVVMVTELQPRNALANEPEKQQTDRREALAQRDIAPTDPNSAEASDIVIPPDILAKAELSDHFETINPDLPDTHSALGNPDSKSFHSVEGNTEAAGGGGMGGLGSDDLIGVGGAASRGTGGGFGGGDGTGIGIGTGAGKGSFGQRNGGGRKLLVKRHGGSPATESAVDKALEWLAYHQEADGHWDIKKYEGGINVSGGIAHDEGVSGIAILAFLGAGHTSKVGSYKDNVKRGLDWILSKQQARGAFTAGDSDYERYDSAIDTLAVVEAYAMSHDAKLGDAAQKGVDFLVTLQDPSGHWGHMAGSTSLLGWAVMALKSAKVAQLKFSNEVFEKAIKRLEAVGEKDENGYWGMIGYDQKNGFPYCKGLTTTAVGMLSLQFMGLGGDTTHMAEILSKNPPTWKPDGDIAGEPQNFYHWYYSTLAMFQTGGDSWKKWNDALKKTLVPNQRKDGDMNGSWDPLTGWDPTGGRVYSTAMGALCLEVYYRYLQLKK